MNEDRSKDLAARQGVSPNLVDAVRDVLAGKKPEPVDVEEMENAIELKKEKDELETTEEGLDPVNKKELKGKHKDRKDKDIDNDGDVDSSDKYLHKRRKAVAKAIGEAEEMCDCGCECGKKVCESCGKPHKEADIKEGAQMVRGPDGQVRYKTNRMPLSLQRMARRKRPLAKRVMRSKIQMNSFDPTEVEEGAMSRIDYQKKSGEKGTGLDTFKKKPAKDTLIANPRTQKVRKVTPSRAKMAVKKGFVYAEHFEGLNEDPFKGQPVGVSVTMKHGQTGKKVKTSFPGTHSAVAGAKSHIAQMQKKGYKVHSKDLMYGKKEEVNELKTSTLANYMSKSAADVAKPGQTARKQDKRIAGQSMADKKIRKAGGYSSDAKVAATEEVNEARRGRPAKNPTANQDTEARHNIVHQLRKAVSLRGQHKVEFKDGKQHKISAAHASQALNKYNNLRTSTEKHHYQNELHKSHDSFHTARQSKTPGAAPKKPGISLGGSDRLKKLMSKD